MATTVPGGTAARTAALALLALVVFAAPAMARPLSIPQQVSFTAPLDYAGADSTNSAIAHGGGQNLVVWEQEAVSEQVPSRTFSTSTVIMGRFVNGVSAPTGDAFQISDSRQLFGRDVRPDVTYDPDRNRFFVVWQSSDVGADTERGGTSDVIRGALVEPDGDTTPSAVLTPDNEGLSDPATAYGAATGEHLVAYANVNGEVLVRTVDADDLAPTGGPQTISEGLVAPFDPGPLPDTAYDRTAGRWLVVWQGQPQPLLLRGDLDETLEVYGRSFDGDLNGSALERISHAKDDPPGADARLAAGEPAVAADEGGGFLVAYAAEVVREFPGLLRPERTREAPPTTREIFARPVSAGGQVAGGAHQVSEPNPEDLAVYFQQSRRPDLWTDPHSDQFLVTWAQQVDEAQFARVDGSIEYEVAGKKVSAVGAPLESEARLSDHRPDATDNQFDGDLPAVTYDRTTCDYIVSWTGEEFAQGIDEKEEVWNRPYDAPACPSAPPPPERPQTQPQAQPQPGVVAGAVTTGVPSRSCASRRSFKIRLVRRRDRKYEFALVKVNGTEVQVTYGKRVTAPVNLVGLPLGRFSVDIEARLKDGRRLKGVRRYFTCTKKLPPSNGLEAKGAL